MNVNNINSTNSPSVAQSPPSLMALFYQKIEIAWRHRLSFLLAHHYFFSDFFFSTVFMLQLPCATSSFIIDCCHQLLTHLLHSFKIGFIIFFWSTYSGGCFVQVSEMRPQTESFHEWQERWTVKGFSDECHCWTVNVYRQTLPAVLANHVMDTRSVQDHHQKLNCIKLPSSTW